MAPVDSGELQTVLDNDLGIKLFVLRNPHLSNNQSVRGSAVRAEHAKRVHWNDLMAVIRGQYTISRFLVHNRALRIAV
jgi:hypothetical protein